jgi:hypothetical protein
MRPTVQDVVVTWLEYRDEIKNIDLKIGLLQESQKKLLARQDDTLARLDSEQPSSECPVGLIYGDEYVVISFNDVYDTFNVQTIDFTHYRDTKEGE